MKFGQEYQKALASADFPQHWRESAIEYKNLKKCIKKIRQQLESIGLNSETIDHLHELIESPEVDHHAAHPANGYYSAAEPTLAPVPEEFTPQLQVLVDSKTGEPLDATLTPATKASLQRLAKHEMFAAGRRRHVGGTVQSPDEARRSSVVSEVEALDSVEVSHQDARWINVPLASAKDFFDLLEPKLQELEALSAAETAKLEEEILDLGDAVENVVEPVRDGFEARRRISGRDLYFWREMFRLYMERPVFYSGTATPGGAMTFSEAKKRLEEFDATLRSSGLLAKMKTPQAKQAAQMFLDVNLDILRIMHFQEMNAQAMKKILKKYDKNTHLEGQQFLSNLQLKYPALITNGCESDSNVTPGGFANSIARDMSAEIASKVLAIVPQVTSWNCPVCNSIAWQPANLGCCRSVFCIRCIIKMQEDGLTQCPVCGQETVQQANGRNIDFEAMDFLEKYFPLEVKMREKENQEAKKLLEEGHGGSKTGCRVA